MPVTRDELLDTSPIPNNGGELRLFRQGNHFAIKIAGGGELMNSRLHGSEDKLAEFACTKIASRPRPRVLIGGLGMGFTLAAALRQLGANAEVVVAELVPAVVTWNRGPLGVHAGNPLQDARAMVRECDVALVLKTEPEAFDAILLDVDNGPEGLTHKANDWLYSLAGLTTAFSALRAGGVLAVWSAGPDARFTERLRQSGFHAEELKVRAHGNKGARHIIWLAEK
ncbi:MAG: hypothetical protein ACOY9J_02420 [Pseudomonadota bacterium]